MKTLGVTGSRKLTPAEAEQVRYELWELDRPGVTWHMGDSTGVDALAREWIQEGTQVHHNTTGWERWQLQRRSRELVDAIAQAGGTLHAWVKGPCPADLTEASWKGAGTWGTVRYAVGKGVRVELHPLTEDAIAPDWLYQKQLTLM